MMGKVRPPDLECGCRQQDTSMAVPGSRCRRRTLAAALELAPASGMLVPAPPLSRRDRLAHGLPPVPLVLPAGLAADQRPRPLRDPWTARYRLLLALRPAAWADRALPARRSLARSSARL